MSLFDDSRSAWGAAANTNPRPVAPSTRVGISWHYDGGAPLNLAGRPHSACLTRVKADQRFHMSSRGWADIGYNLLVCQHGRVIEGRGADLQGAHSPGVNEVHYGVQFMVGGSEAPTAAAYARAVRLAGELAAHSGRSLRQWGHRDDKQASTDCPGDGIEAWVKRQGNAAPAKPAAPAPAPAPKPKATACTVTVSPARLTAHERVVVTAAVSPAVPGVFRFDWTYPGKPDAWQQFGGDQQARSGRAQVVSTPGTDVVYRARFYPADPKAYAADWSPNVAVEVVTLADYDAAQKTIRDLRAKLAAATKPPATS